MPEFGTLHSELRSHARSLRLGDDVPALVVVPEHAEASCPMLLWMHGRTAHKELDSGRFLRLLRQGIGSCSLDLPGHGERFEQALHEPAAVLSMVERMVGEIDAVVADLIQIEGVDPARIAIGGISAGGMASLIRCCRDHPFAAVCVEATTGNLAYRASNIFANPERVKRLDPIEHLAGWRPVPLLALHNLLDEWVDVDGQRFFIEALRERYPDPGLIDFHVYERPTGAPYEHSGFGQFSVDAKNRQTEFLVKHLGVER
ncbi:MAG: alpha/beta fold hydrolase [Planctomycetota bacterium]|nr:alpha/beta fold hydrolase [Planctomycetota bacterium]